GLPRVERHHRLDEGDLHPERLEHGPVPLGIAVGEVVVDGDEVRAAAGEPVEVERGARDERLALAGLHLGDVALVEDDPAHQLHVEHPLIRRALAGLADGREGLEEELVEALAVLEPLPELRRLALELGLRQILELGLEGRDVRRLLPEPLQAASLAGAQELLESTSRIGHLARVAAYNAVTRTSQRSLS